MPKDVEYTSKDIINLSRETFVSGFSYSLSEKIGNVNKLLEDGKFIQAFKDLEMIEDEISDVEWKFRKMFNNYTDA